MKNLYRGLLTAIGIVGLWLGANTYALAQMPVLLKTTEIYESSNFVATPTGVYFISTRFPDQFLWKTDGTPVGTQLVKTVDNQPIKANTISSQVLADGRLYFVVTLYSSVGLGSSSTLWCINESGTAQKVGGGNTGGFSQLIAAGGQLYFTSTNPNGSSSIWQTYGDGTQANLVYTHATQILDFVYYKNRIFFLARQQVDTYSPIDLWQVSSSMSSAVALKEISINSASGSNLYIAGSKLYINGVGNSNSSYPFLPTLYQSDGTATGTSLVLNPADLSVVITDYRPKVVNDQLYLVSYSGYSIRALTGPIYKVKPDGSRLELASDIYGRLPAGIRLLHPNDFAYYKGLYYFSAFGPNNDYELWRSDGTLVKDIQTGPGSSDPQNFYVYNDVLYFTATDNQYRKLYRTDGTTAGTQPVSDLGVGTGISSSPANNLTGYKNDLFLTAYSADTGFGLWKIPNVSPTPPTTPTPPATTSLTLTQPTYDCTTGQLSLSTTGGNGQPIDYRIAGLRDWATSNTFAVPTYQRTGTTFILEARQSGSVTSLPFLAACQTTTSPTSPTQPTGTGLSLSPPAYDCTTGQLTLSTTGGNDQPVEYRIAGLRDWATSNTFTVPTYQRNGTSFTLQARQSGVVISLPFTATCQTTPPATYQPLSVSALPLNCQTGALQLVTTGGDGTSIDYKVPGLGNYSSSLTFTVPTYQRTNTTFTLYARQNGREVTTTYMAACANSSRMASAETSKGLSVVVYPNPVGERFTVGVSGAAGQAVRFQLTNLSGQTVVEQRVAVSSDAHTETLSLPVSGAGLYLLRVSTNTQSKTVKVIK